MTAKLRVGVLISGRGSNLKALIDAAAQPEFEAQIALVIASTEGAGGLAHARHAGIPAIALSAPRRAAGEAAARRFEEEMSRHLREYAVELVCLAGFMRLLGNDFVEEWRDRLINIHPSLLPAFKGLDVQERVLEAGVRIAGCTVHFVRTEMDAGPILVQAAVPVLPADDAESLSARILVAEHRAYPLAVRLIAQRRVQVTDDRVVFVQGESAAVDARLMLNPEDFPAV